MTRKGMTRVWSGSVCLAVPVLHLESYRRLVYVRASANHMGIYRCRPLSKTCTAMPTSTTLSMASGRSVRGKRGVRFMPRQPNLGAPSSTLRWVRSVLSGSVGCRSPVVWSMLGSLQLGTTLDDGYGGRQTARNGALRDGLLTVLSGRTHRSRILAAWTTAPVSSGQPSTLLRRTATGQ